MGGGGGGERSQLISSCARPGKFLDFLRTFRKFPGNSGILPSPYRKRFPPWAYAKLPYRAWENCSRQCKGLFQAQKRKITMTSKENRNFCHSIWTNLCCWWQDLYFWHFEHRGACLQKDRKRQPEISSNSFLLNLQKINQ
jgi:hypothetical protein